MIQHSVFSWFFCLHDIQQSLLWGYIVSFIFILYHFFLSLCPFLTLPLTRTCYPLPAVLTPVLITCCQFICRREKITFTEHLMPDTGWVGRCSFNLQNSHAFCISQLYKKYIFGSERPQLPPNQQLIVSHDLNPIIVSP